MAGKLFGNSGLADTSCPSDKKCGRTVLILFPTQHLLIDFASEYSFCHRLLPYFGAKVSIKSQLPKEKSKICRNSQ